ncbi:hypothetical protein ACFLZG_03790 [Thermodesulfobacteriota bacterium]
MNIVKEEEDQADLLFKLAKALEKLGDINKAIIFLVKGGEIDKGNVDIKINPNHEEAREYLKYCA